MVDVNSQNNSVSINVSSGGNSASIKATPDLAQYYSEKSREWATSNRIVDNTDYSSKYYAEKSKESEAKAENYERSVIEKYNSFVDISSQAESEIADLRDNSFLELNNAKNASIADINNALNDNLEEAKANIEVSKANALGEIENKRSNAVEQIETLSEETLSDIKDLGVETRANLDLSNLSEEGEKHFLGKSNITNCLLEVPQRIKYTLENGVLIIKAGSVAIFPYGTEDKTEQLPIGSTFLNDNLKVVDTCWDGAKFFVWAELQSGFPRKSTYNTTDFIYLDRNGSNLRTPTNTACSGSTADTTLGTYLFWYDTTNNYVKFSVDNGVTWNTNNSLPLVIAQGNSTTGYTSIQHTFNGWGYMGSTIWVDKGVKGLIPNGRNEDGTLKNTIQNNERVLTKTLTAGGKFYFNISEIGTGNIAYNEQLNLNKWVGNNNTSPTVLIGDISVSNGQITSFQPKQVFHALDYNDKTEIISWSIPDYSAGVSATFPFTAPSNGILQARANTSNASNKAAIDGGVVFNANITASNGQATLQKVLMAKGQVATVTSGSFSDVIFYPLKGVK